MAGAGHRSCYRPGTAGGGSPARPEPQLRTGSRSQASSAPGCGSPEPATAARALFCPFTRGQRPGLAAPQSCAQLPYQAPCRLGATSQSPQLHRIPVSSAGTNFLPPGPRAGSWQLAFPTSPFATLAGRALSAALQPPVTGAQRSPRILSNKAGARRRPGERLGLGAGTSEPWQDIHAPASAASRGGREQTRRGEESVLLRARKPPGLLILLAQLPLPERIPAVPVGLGRAEGEAVRTDSVA